MNVQKNRVYVRRFDWRLHRKSYDFQLRRRLLYSHKKARVAFGQRALLLAKRARSRAALGPTLSLPARVVTLKTSEVWPYASGHRSSGGEFCANGAARHEVFAHVGVAGRRWWSGHRAFGCGAAMVGRDVLVGAVGGEKLRIR